MLTAILCAALLVQLSEGRSRSAAHPEPRAPAFRTSQDGNVAAPPPQGSISVVEYGAVSNCTKFDKSSSPDNTAAFQKALQAAAAGRVGVVYVPWGCYRLDGQLSIPQGVTLKGSYSVCPAHGTEGKRPEDVLKDGTVLLSYGGSGDEQGTPFITMQEPNAAVEGMVFFYPEQTGDQKPIPFPWTIAMRSANTRVVDVELLNSFNGISAVKAHRHFIQRIMGQPVNIGVFIDETYDIGRLQDVHFNPWFSKVLPYYQYQLTYGTAFVFGRSDWEYVLNTFAFAYAVGYHFIQTPTGSMNGNFVGLGMDFAYNASVLVDASQPAGLLITNGEFTAFHSKNELNSSQEATHVVVSSTNSGPVSFVNTAFWGPCAQVALLQGRGPTSFTNCQFVEWDEQFHDGRAALHGTAGSVSVQGSYFNQAKFPGLFEAKMSGVVFTGNMLVGNQTIDCKAKSCQNSNNIYSV